jgi:hypothetical protein
MMNAVSSLSAAVSSGGWSHAAAPIQSVSVKVAQPVQVAEQPSDKSSDKSSNQSRQAQIYTAPKVQTPLSQSQSQGVPLGVLQTVSAPASSDMVASLDYHDMRMALQSGNLATAQQAYLRLQGDLNLHQAAAITAASSADSYLNVRV